MFKRNGKRLTFKPKTPLKKAITLYDDFSYLYRRVISELNVFDNDGNLSSRQQAEAGVAWQWGKAAWKAKKSGRKKRAQEQEQFCLDIAEGLHQKEYEGAAIQQEVYSRLDKIVQSSALEECINSIIRPYLNTSKNQVSQEFFNLIMHYHNYRRYRDGVRKNKTPMEILTGKEQTKDWIAILFEIIKKKKPELLAS